MGHGVLLQFPSVVAAVECAVAIQNMMVERNVDMPRRGGIVYRIGVHLGDVLIDGDIYWARGSTSRRGSRASASPAASQYPAPLMIRSAESLLSVSGPSVCKN